MDELGFYANDDETIWNGKQAETAIYSDNELKLSPEPSSAFFQALRLMSNRVYGDCC